MKNVKFMSASEAVAMIDDEAVIGLVGGGGGLVEASKLHEAVESVSLRAGIRKV